MKNIKKEKGEKQFSFDRLLAKLSCRKLWAWVPWMACVFLVAVAARGHDHSWIKTLIHWGGVVTLAFIMGNVTEKIGLTLANRTDINIGKGKGV